MWSHSQVTVPGVDGYKAYSSIHSRSNDFFAVNLQEKDLRIWSRVLNSKWKSLIENFIFCAE